MQTQRWRVLAGALAGAACLSLGMARADETFPSRPLTIINPWAAGSSTDVMARALAEEMHKQLGQSVVVMPREGGSGVIGMNALAQSASDGLTMAFTPMTPITIQPNYVKGLKLNPDAVQPLCGVTENILGVSVRADSPYRTVRELVAAAKEKPLSYGSPGPNSAPFLAMDQLERDQKLKLTHVPYKGDAGSLQELLAGRLDFVSSIAASAAPQETQRVIGIEGASPRVLVVDDDQLNRRVIVDALAPLGFDMREARDGREGWRVALEWRPQAMIIDLRMPEMDGLTLIRQIRQDPALNEVVVIASSASVYQEDQQQSIVAGAQAFLPKPVSISLLLRQLQRGLRLTWRRAADVEVEPNAPASPRAVVNLERLAALPDALRKRLEEVAIVADMCGARSVIEEIRAIDAELADALAAFEQNFEYGKILELAQNAKA